MSYPVFKSTISTDDLKDHFTICPEEWDLSKRIRNDINRLGFVVLLKTYQYLGYPPQEREDIPAAVVEWIAGQLAIGYILFQEYQWRGRIWDFHCSLIRQHSGFRPFESEDYAHL